jgi:hypothetical protein
LLLAAVLARPAHLAGAALVDLLAFHFVDGLGLLRHGVLLLNVTDIGGWSS